MRNILYFAVAIISPFLIVEYGSIISKLAGVYLFLCVVCPIFLIPLFLFLDVPASYGRLPRRK